MHPSPDPQLDWFPLDAPETLARNGEQMLRRAQKLAPDLLRPDRLRVVSEIAFLNTLLDAMELRAKAVAQAHAKRFDLL